MNFEELLTQFGYPVLSLGTVLEGEAALIFGGILAKKGFLSLYWVIAVAFATTLACDQFFFYLGRTQGYKAFVKWPKLKDKTRKVTSLVQRHHIWLAIFFRFVYGFRSVTPFAIGLCRISPMRFLTLNLIGISLWVIGLAWLGYFCGVALEKTMDSVRNWEIWIAAGLVLAGSLLWALVSLHRLIRARLLCTLQPSRAQRTINAPSKSTVGNIY